MIRLPALLLAATLAGIAAPACAQPSAAAPERQLDMLLRQDASLRERIAQIQLDRLVARVDDSFGHHASAKQPASAALTRDFDRYTF